MDQEGGMEWFDFHEGMRWLPLSVDSFGAGCSDTSIDKDWQRRVLYHVSESTHASVYDV